MRKLFILCTALSFFYLGCRTAENGNTFQGSWAFHGISWDSAAGGPGLAAMAWLNELNKNSRINFIGDSFQWVSAKGNGMSGHYVVRNDSILLQYPNKQEAMHIQSISDTLVELQNAEGIRMQLKKLPEAEDR
jgi:hypothetical protein